MGTNYKKISKNIQQITINKNGASSPLKWIDIANPGKEEIEYLRKKYKFNLKHLQSSSAKVISERPQLEKTDAYLFIILQFPVLSKEKIIKGEEIDFFIGHGYLITLHTNKIKVLSDFFNTIKKDEQSSLSYELTSSSILLYEILNKLINHCYALIDYHSEKIKRTEEIIFNQEQRKAALQILYLRRNIINLRKIMQNHKNIMKKLIEMKSSLLPQGTIRECYSVLIEHSKRIWEFSENQKEMIEALHDTNESLLNHSLSNIMKILTIFSVSILPVSVLGTIFGTNFTKSMPLINNEHGFLIMVSLMVLGIIAFIFFFIKKRWL